MLFGVHFCNCDGAQNLGRYDFWKDVAKIENFNKLYSSSKCGYAIFVTNDSLYWRLRSENAMYADFALYCGREVTSHTLKWYEGKQEPTVTSVGKSRKDGIEIHGTYNIEWKGLKNGFRYLILQIHSDRPGESQC